LASSGGDSGRIAQVTVKRNRRVVITSLKSKVEREMLQSVVHGEFKDSAAKRVYVSVLQ